MPEIGSKGAVALARISMESCEARVHAVVVTYNASPWIESCLESLMSSHHPVEVIVVDNASADETLSIVAKHIDMTCLPQDRNLGFGKANNIGMRMALQQGADFVFLLNQDARVAPETIGRLVNCAQENSGFGILSPLHLNRTGTEIDYLFSRHIARAANTSFTKLLSDLYFGHPDNVYPVSFVNAAAWLLTRECLERVGGFDPLFFMYGEDDDLCNRVVSHGFSIGLVPSAIVYHAREGNENGEQGLVTRLNRALNSRKGITIVQLKQPTSSFLTQLMFWVNDTIYRCLRALLSGNLKNVVLFVLAALGTVICLPRIWKHRKVGLTPGPHWL
jgi:GT2 family glycosyltransferase